MRNTGDLVFKIPDAKTSKPKTKKGINPLLILGILAHFRSF
jgi:hypothetical protein